ncbi:MAG: hypothetical protein SOV71_00060 [Anaerovoracaceae bacterium]|nr:hypothetical protein [Bacillota bacterium]MDY2669940.1 hypothetical protein [Anaerovoracaceae bacterium]
MPGRKKLSIEIGPEYIRAAEISERKNQIDVHGVVEVKTPKDCVRNGYILNPDRLGEILRMELAAEDIRAKNAVFTVDSDEILVGDAEIASGSRRAMEDEVIKKACELFGLGAPSKKSAEYEDDSEDAEDDEKAAAEEDGGSAEADLDSIDNYCVSYKKTEESDDGSSVRVIIFAAPLALIDTYRILAERTQLIFESADCTMNSVYQWMKRTFEHEAVMLVKVDSNESSAAVMTDEVLRGHYVLSTPADAVLDAVQEMESKEELEGDESLDEGFDVSENPVAEAAGPFVEELKSVISAFLENNPAEYIDKIIVAGERAGMTALAAEIQRQTGIAVLTLDDLPEGSVARDLDPFGELDAGQYIDVIGAVIDPLGFASSSGSGSRGGIREELAMKIMAGILAALIIIMAVCGVRYLLLKSHNREMNSQLDKIKYIEDIYDQYKDAETKNSEVSALDKSTKQKNELLSQLYSDLESKMPTDAKITSMNSSDDLVIFSISASGKEAAAEMIMQLRKFDYMSDISVSELTDTKNAAGSESVEFTVSANLTGDSGKDYSLSDGANDDGISDTGYAGADGRDEDADSDGSGSSTSSSESSTGSN